MIVSESGETSFVRGSGTRASMHASMPPCQVLMHNIKRISALVQDLSAGMVWIRDIYNWKSKLHSTLALLVSS